MQSKETIQDMRLTAHRPGTRRRIRVSPNTCRDEARQSSYVHEEAQLGELSVMLTRWGGARQSLYIHEEAPLGGLLVMLDRAWVSWEDQSINRILAYGTRKIYTRVFYTRVSPDSHYYSTTTAVAWRPSNQAADLMNDSVRSGSCQRNTG